MDKFRNIYTEMIAENGGGGKMSIEIRPLRKKDHEKILKYAAEGMGVRNYTDKPDEINLYSKYFWYMELSRSTQLIAAYEGDEPVGVLLADMKGEKKAYTSVRAKIFIKTAELLMAVMFRGGANTYSETNESMLSEFIKDNHPDGEMGFLAVEPGHNGKGIGTILLNELAEREKGKQIYLFTDSGCTYQFYDKRGFTKEAERDIVLNLHEKKIPLKCFLYSKIL